MIRIAKAMNVEFNECSDLYKKIRYFILEVTQTNRNFVIPFVAKEMSINPIAKIATKLMIGSKLNRQLL